MGVYIKGMEMPKDCLKCPFCLFADGYWKCLVDGSHADFGGTCRPQNCPLVPVPPHGRLIESAKLYGKAEDIKTKALSVCDKPQSWQFGGFWAIEQIEAALTNAPTIIPASGGKEDE